MNDFSEIEAELRKLRPRDTRPELLARVEVAMKQRAPVTAAVVKRRKLNWNWLPLGLGLAAAASFFVMARLNVDRTPRETKTVVASSASATAPAPAPARVASFVPAGVTQVVYDTRNEGLELPRGSNTPVRRVRSRKRETLHFENPQTGASLRVIYPAEEVRLIPLEGQ